MLGFWLHLKLSLYLPFSWRMFFGLKDSYDKVGPFVQSSTFFLFLVLYVHFISKVLFYLSHSQKSLRLGGGHLKDSFYSKQLATLKFWVLKELRCCIRFVECFLPILILLPRLLEEMFLKCRSKPHFKDGQEKTEQSCFPWRSTCEITIACLFESLFHDIKTSLWF